MSQDATRSIEPNILYFGTPVALVSSLNEDGTTNVAPISSFWALGWTLALGILNDTKTLSNLEAEPECVVNLPTPGMWKQVEKLAPLTGCNPVPDEKASRFRHEKNKFAAAGLTPLDANGSRVERVAECPVQLEARVQAIYAMRGDPRLHKLGGGSIVEVEVLRVNVSSELVMQDHYIDPAKWQPLIYNFRHYFGLGAELGKTFRAEV